MKTKNLIILAILIIILIIGFLIFYSFKKESSEKSKLNVVEEIDLSLDSEIDQDDISDYKEFIEKNQQYAKPISWEEFKEQMAGAGTYLIHYPLGKTTRNLRKKIIEELNIGFLLEKINQTELKVTTVAVSQYEKHNEKKLLFTDPNIGTFSVLLMVPNKEQKKYSGIIGLHGHADNIESMRSGYHGKSLAEAGFVVILPSFRAMDCSKAPEEIITRELVLNGFTLMGIRIYETSLLIKYLKYKDFINKIGIIGHSGGSDVAYLTSIINQDLQAIAFDFYPKPDSLCEGKIHCETIPGLAYYKQQINDPSTLKIPSKKFDYDFDGENDREELINFFKENLIEK